MKVSIKVPADRIPAVRDAVAAWEQSHAEKKGADCYNADQHLSLAEHVLSYKGQRWPFLRDGAATAFSIAIHGGTLTEKPEGLYYRNQLWRGGPPKVEVLEYTSSAPYLGWWQTTLDWVEGCYWGCSEDDEGILLQLAQECRGLKPDISSNGHLHFETEEGVYASMTATVAARVLISRGKWKLTLS